MGIFSSDRTTSMYNENVEPAYGYGGVDAAAKIKLEGYQNDMALFGAIIRNDYKSARAEHEGLLEEASVITEGTVADIFNKIKELIKKLWAKIKGMIQSFMTKFMAVFIRDNKQLVKKYHKQILSQMTDSKRKYDELKFKMHEGFYDCLTGKKEPKMEISTSIKLSKMMDKAYKNSLGKNFRSTSLEQMKEDLDKYIIEFVNNEYEIKMSELSDLKKELDDEYIGAIDEYEGYTSSLNSSVESELQTMSKTKKEIERNQRAIDSEFRVYLKDIDSRQKEADNLVVGTDKDKKEVSQERKDAKAKSANMEYYLATKIQSISSELTNWFLSFLKSYCKEVRSLYIKAAARRQVSKENAIILDDIIDEAVSYDIDSIFDESEVDIDISDDGAAAEIDDVDDITA